jgi:FlgN protein
MSPQPEVAHLVETLERQLRLLRELSGELTACRPALTAMDLDGIYSHIARQLYLCEQVRQTEQERHAAWQEAAKTLGRPAADGDLRTWMKRLEPADAGELSRVFTAMALAEGEIREQNRVHSLFIEGTRRTLQVLSNALATLSPTYTLPAASTPFANSRVQR